MHNKWFVNVIYQHYFITLLRREEEPNSISVISEVIAGTIEGKYQESTVREAASGCAQPPSLGAQAELKGHMREAAEELPP